PALERLRHRPARAGRCPRKTSRYEEITTTFSACGPLSPSRASNSTFAPSGSDLKPLPAMPLKWTKRSFVPSSGVMKPYPFASLNHLTVPVAMDFHLPHCTHERVRKVVLTNATRPL